MPIGRSVLFPEHTARGARGTQREIDLWHCALACRACIHVNPSNVCELVSGPCGGVSRSGRDRVNHSKGSGARLVPHATSFSWVFGVNSDGFPHAAAAAAMRFSWSAGWPRAGPVGRSRRQWAWFRSLVGEESGKERAAVTDGNSGFLACARRHGGHRAGRSATSCLGRNLTGCA
jgi:hypothetical protein